MTYLSTRYPQYTVQVLRDTPEGEIEIDVDVEIEPGEASYFDAVEGIGSPGYSPEPHFLEARHRGRIIPLSACEILDAEQLALDAYQEENKA